LGTASEHFNFSEFSCKGERCCGHSHPVCYGLIEALEELRGAVGEYMGDGRKGIVINSGFRCRVYNRKVGGSLDSEHCKGTAADIRVEGLPAGVLAEIVENVLAFRKGGIGVYDTFVHVDVRRDGPARWKGVG